MKLAINAPQTRLFFSVDLVGSTAYKQSEKEWQPKFLSFYREFPQALSDALTLKIKTIQESGFEPPVFEFWKAVGDELLYVCQIQQLAQVKVAIESWLDAQQSYEIQTLHREKLQKTKGSVFAATFPGPDSLVAIPRTPEVGSDTDMDVVSLNEAAISALAESKTNTDGYLLDYLGPSMDTGFRVVGRSTAQYFTMSVEAAWAYSEACRYEGNDKFDVELIEEIPLKGVWRSRPYPIFAVDRMKEDPVNKALQVLHPHKCAPDQIKEICLACERSENWPSKLYISNANFPEMTELPKDVLRTPDAPGNDMAGFETTVNEEPTNNMTEKNTSTKSIAALFQQISRASELTAEGGSENRPDIDYSDDDPWISHDVDPWAK